MTQEIPVCCAKFIKCKLKGNSELRHPEGLSEPVEPGNLPKHIMVGRSLNKVSEQQETMVSVVNVSPSPVKIYKGVCLASMVPSHDIFSLNRKIIYNRGKLSEMVLILVLN